MDFGEAASNAVTWMSASLTPPSNANSISSAYRHHENIKRRAYGQRIHEVEHASFTPLVLSATGDTASEGTAFYKRLASLLAAKWGDEYCVVMGWIRCCLSFSLLRSAIACIRGARSSSGHFLPLHLHWISCRWSLR